MGMLGGFLALVAVVLFLIGVVKLIKKKSRKRGFIWVLLSFILLIISSVLVNSDKEFLNKVEQDKLNQQELEQSKLKTEKLEAASYKLGQKLMNAYVDADYKVPHCNNDIVQNRVFIFCKSGGQPYGLFEVRYKDDDIVIYTVNGKSIQHKQKLSPYIDLFDLKEVDLNPPIKEALEKLN